MAGKMQAPQFARRLQREIRMLQSDPPPGVCAWPCDNSLSHLRAQIQGPDGTVYAKGLFKLEIRVPDRYPFEPPTVRFETPIYHPNIDSGGRICLDILNMAPKGAWKPSLNIPTVLASIGLLLAEPNPDDGLMEDITAEYKYNRMSFDTTATRWTHQYAMQEELATGDNGAKPPAAQYDVQLNQSPSVVNLKGTATEIVTELGNHDQRQHELSVYQQEVQASRDVDTTGTNKVGKSSVVSSSKLNLGTKLSLEKGTRESGKQKLSVGAVDVSAVTSKPALACIENTVETGQGTVQELQTSKKTLVESTMEKETGNGIDMGSEHKENSQVANRSQPLGESVVSTRKTKSTASSCDHEKLKKPRGNASPRTHSSSKAEKQVSVIATTPSAVAALESQCPEKKSKYFMVSSKSSRNSSIRSLKSGEKADNLDQDGTKGSTSIAADTHPVRFSLISNPVDRPQVLVNDLVRPSSEACASTIHKAFFEIPERPQTSLVNSPTLVVSMEEDDYEKNRGHGQIHNDAGQFEYGQSSNGSSERVDEHAISESIVRGTPMQVKGDHDMLATKSLTVRRIAQSTTTASSIVQRRAEPQRKEFRANEVDIMVLPDDSYVGKEASKVRGAVRPQMGNKPPIPAKPATNIIVLDSESDEEPPKGRSRLSLPKRRGVKNKIKV